MLLWCAGRTDVRPSVGRRPLIEEDYRAVRSSVGARASFFSIPIFLSSLLSVCVCVCEPRDQSHRLFFEVSIVSSAGTATHGKRAGAPSSSGFCVCFFFRDRGADCSIPPPLLQRQCLSSLPVVPGSRLMRASRSAFGPFLLTSVAASCAASLGGFRHAASRLSSDNRNNNDNNTSKRPQSRFSCRCCCCCCCFSGTPPLLLRPAVAL